MRMSVLTRVGLPWDDTEVQQLLKEIKDGLSTAEIANAHKRTTGSISARLREIAADFYHNNEMTVEKIQSYTNLSEDEVVGAIERRNWQMKKAEERAEKKEAKQTGIGVPTGELLKMISLLTEIRDGIQELVSSQKQAPKKILIKKPVVAPMFQEDL